MGRKKKRIPTDTEVEQLIDDKIDAYVYDSRMSESSLEAAFNECYEELLEEYAEDD